MKTISVLIPTFNEEENARPIYEAIKQELSSNCAGYDYEIVFIDNKSQDNTRSILRELCKEDRRVKAIFNCKNFGQFNSPVYGLMQTSGDCAIMLCADFQDPVELIHVFVRYWEEGYKIVCGVKSSSKETPIMYYLRSLYYKTIRRFSSVEQIEHFTGFGLYDKSFIDVLRRLHDPTPFIRGIVTELGPERKEVEYTQQRRRAGKSKNNLLSLYDAAMLSFTSYTKVGMRFATFLGFIIAGGSFLIALFYLIAKLLFWDAFSMGYAPTMIAVFFMGGVQLTFLGFLGEYIMGMNARVMNRPLVVEEERLNFLNESDDGGQLSNTVQP